MTDKQLFEAFGGVREKYLAEMLDDEPQRALELRPVKRSPVKKAMIAVAACAAAVAVAFGGLAISGKIDIPVLFDRSKDIVLQKDGISEGCSVLLRNIRFCEDWLKDHPDKAEELRGSTDEEYDTITAELIMSFSDWEKLPEDAVEMRVCILADGKPVKHFGLIEYLYYNILDVESEEIDLNAIFEGNTKRYSETSHYIFSKNIPEPDFESDPNYYKLIQKLFFEYNPDLESEVRIYPSPISFDVKKGTRQITAVVEYAPLNSFDNTGKIDITDDCYYTNTDNINRYSKIASATYTIESITGGGTDNYPEKIYSFNPKGLGTFSAERSEYDPDNEAIRIYTSNRVLTINTDGISTDTPYYLTVLLNGQPLLDEEFPLLIDPKQQTESAFKIPERLIKRDSEEKTLWLLAIPVVDDKKYADGVICSVPVSEKYFFTAGTPTAEYFYSTGVIYRESGFENSKSWFDYDTELLFRLYSDKIDYESGEPVCVKALIDNLSEHPAELMQYISDDPYGAESVTSPIIAEFTEQNQMFQQHNFKNDKQASKSLILEPGGSCCREFVIDSGVLSTENMKYRITAAYSIPGSYYPQTLYLEIELNKEDQDGG